MSKIPLLDLEFDFVIFIKSNSIFNNISKFSTFGIYQDFVPPLQIYHLGLKLRKFSDVISNFQFSVFAGMIASGFSQ